MATSMMKYLTEFLGTLAFLFVICKFPNPYMIAGALLVVILIGGKVSGGHFNPAVSIMKYADGAMKRNDLMLYILAQVLGGLVALKIFQMV